MGRKRVLEAILRPIGFGVHRLKGGENSFLDTALRYKKQVVSDIARKLDFTVVRGPFKGLRLLEMGAWSDYDLLSKVLGSYELEVFQAVEHQISRSPNVIVNVGASEGYYAVGLKRRLPDADVYTFDIDQDSFEALDRCAKLNGVTINRLKKFDFKNPLVDISSSAAEVRPLFVVACEGCENGIAEMSKSVAAVSSFIVELHDLFVPGTTERLVNFLAPSHEIKLIDQSGRFVPDFPELTGVPGPIASILLDEFRGASMQWIYAVPR
ncbi:MAG: hypothetical protein LCH86_12415 [Proteobacteria bacterium]|nr:hypothetical protein [Pseudomonadota bacterium]